MLRPGRAQVALRLEPAQFAALRIAVDAGVALRENHLQFAVAIYVADSDQGGDVVGGILMLLPLAVGKLVPVGSGEDLVLSVTIQVGNRQALLRLPLILQVAGNRLNIEPGADTGIGG